MRSTRRSRNSHNRGRAAAFLLAAAGMLLAALFLPATLSPVRAQSIPADAQGGCPVPSTTFNHWFQTGTPSLNGVVNPADSLGFSPSLGNCSFYQWSEQMFLWLTSPAPSIYGGGSHIFDSPTFYDVSPLNAQNQRTLSQHKSGIFHFGMPVRVGKPGPHGLPMVKDRHGKLFEVERPKFAPSGKQLVLNNLGKEVEIESATLKQGKPVFMDKAGKPILKARPVIAPHLLKLNAPPTQIALAKKVGLAQRFTINNKLIFLDLLGNPIDTEEGQADGSVLMAQPPSGSTVGSLVYYASMVNDVYAYFLTGAKTGGITPAPTQFPINSTDLGKITTFASGHGKTFPDPNALAIEIKTAWVETTGLANPGSYITMKTTIPTYTKTSTQWTASGSREATLALVSVHVVGSVFGHPEMVWATFEHFGNTPNAAYTYTSNTGSKTVPQSTAGTWLFCASGSGGPFNVAHMTNPSGDTISVVPGQTISASDTLRVLPWGMATTNAASNTQLVSINHSVASQMPSGDIRNNYFMLGATWTNGQPPNNSNQVGTNNLSNSALETYVQGIGTNCFSCHNGNMLGDSAFSGLSHIWFPIQPLHL